MDAISIVIPARNEERFIGSCLESIRRASANYNGRIETIVVLNRCTDRTEEIARSLGARIVREDARNLSKIRNAGAGVATGRILITIDADSTMTAGTLSAVERALSSRKTIGGGVWIFPERLSIGIVASVIVLGVALAPVMLRDWISGGLFWCYREDFKAIGGFDESLVSVEDIDFARRLKARGKKIGRPFRTLRGGHIVTSCRKFDRFGDWALVTNPRLVWQLLEGTNQTAADEFFYKIER
jgi:glycosyltransferase involved in cell wall biosynthesis